MATFPRRKVKTQPSLLRRTRVAKPLVQAHSDDAELAALPPAARRRGIYLLPNAFTTAALFCGFYAIVMAMELRFDHAAIAIFAAMILDGVDGRVARLTNTQSEFGAQYDSLEPWSALWDRER